MAVETSYPVKVLREHTVALEAALTVCLADPAHKPVHRLRTETRRIEAQLLLLSQLSELPEHGEQTERLQRALRRLRRAAGEVRDLDVQRKKLEELANDAGEQPVNENAEASASGKAALSQGAIALRDHLHARREDTATKLQKLLARHQIKAARAAEKLLKAMAPGEDTPLPAGELLQHAEALFTRGGLLSKGNLADLTEDELHSVRKAAKAARYLAEIMPGNADADAAASRFEALQEAGGQWHDALELTRLAKRFLGKKHALTMALATERNEQLERYREALSAETQPREAQETARRASRKRVSGKRSSGKRPSGKRPARSVPAAA